MPIQLGLEAALANPLACLRDRRLGLLMNQASVDENRELACDLLATRYPNQLKCIFSPQHGIWGEQQANMLETEHTLYEPLGIPVYSLYSETRRPTASMLDGIDCLVIDLQDVGTRVYTFIWTMLECLHACSAQNKAIVLLDRPNPLGGDVFEGPLLDLRFRSFVGGDQIPMRHGLTLAEMGQWLVASNNIDVELHLVPMRGWSRNQLYSDTGRPWLWTSPNIPTMSSLLLYPGQVLLEGTNLSEGRGTTRPFELIGAPFLESSAWMAAMRKFQLPGLELRPTRFTPVFDKWQGESCTGIDLQITDKTAVRSVATTVALIATAAQLAPDGFAWLDPPYEYEFHLAPIDILFGNANLRRAIDTHAGLDDDTLKSLLDWDESRWKNQIESVLLYS